MRRWLAYELAKNDHSRVGFWPLLQNDRDLSGRNNHATAVGGAAPVRCPGKNGFRLAQAGFDGVSQARYLSLGNATDLAFDNNFSWSVSLWFFRETTTGQHALVSFYGPTINSSWAGWRIWFDSQNNQVGFTCTSNYANHETVEGYAKLPATPSFGWYQVVLTYAGSGTLAGFHLFVNGQRQAISWNLTTFLNSWVTSQLAQANGYIGYGPLTTDNGANGAIRIIKAYKRELSPREIVGSYFAEASVDTFGRTEAEKQFILYLFLRGHQPLDSTGNNPPLFVQGGGPSAGLDLFVNAGQPIDTPTGLDLFIDGNSSLNNSFPLYLAGSGAIEEYAFLNLVVGGNPVSSGNRSLDLFILGGQAQQGSVPLTVTGGGLPGSMNLFVEGFDRGPLSTNMNLFIDGRTTPAASSLPLTLWNNISGVYEAVPLFLQTTTGTPLTGSMDLYLARPQTEVMTPLFIWGKTPASSSVPLYVYGNVPISTPTLPLVLADVLASSGVNVPLYVHGY